LSIIDEKIELEEQLHIMASQYLEHLGSELNGKLGMELDNSVLLTNNLFLNLPTPPSKKI